MGICAVVCKWLPPSLPQEAGTVPFTYNVTIFLNGAVIYWRIFTDTSAYISARDIPNADPFTVYHWGVSAGTEYGYTEPIVATYGFKFITGNTYYFKVSFTCCIQLVIVN